MSTDDVRGLLLEETGWLKFALLRHGRDQVADALGKMLANPIVEAVAERAGGLPLYIHFVIEDILAGHFQFDELPSRLPPSLDAYFDDLLRRLSIGQLQALLTPLVVSIAWDYEPFDDDTLLLLMVRRKVLSGMDDHYRQILREGLRAVQSMLQSSPIPGSGRVGHELYHASLRDHMRRDRGSVIGVQTELARRELIDLVSAWHDLASDHPARGYVIRHGPRTLIDEQQWGRSAAAAVVDVPAARNGNACHCHDRRRLRPPLIARIGRVIRPAGDQCQGVRRFRWTSACREWTATR